MRIQILPLPPVTLGDATHVPFVVVLDRLEDPLSMAETAALRRMSESWGARGLLAVGPDDSIEISPHLDIPDDLAQALLAQLDTPAPEAENAR